MFVSYASENAAEAAWIAEALRAAGVEVWFDRDELHGGDAWDSKIRGRIAACALFVPVISAATQARLEGYFRIEWKLAARRTHAMAAAKAFLLPVVIDGTGEAEAHVPDEFREVQWTRMPGGTVPADFGARVRVLLGGPAPISAERAAGERGVSAAPERNAGRRRGPAIGLVAAGVFVVATWGYFAAASRRAADAGPRLATAETPAAPKGKAQRNVAQARALYEPWDFATADDFKLADRLLREATELEPLDAGAWAALAIQSYGQQVFGFDRSEARADVLRVAAERAGKLAPASERAQLAQALHYRRSPGNDDEARRLLQALAERQPADKFVLRQLGAVLGALGRPDEALGAYDRAMALPGGDVIAGMNRALKLMDLGRIDEAEAEIDAALAARPDYWLACLMKPALLLQFRGRVDLATAALGKIPARVMADERVAAVAAYYWFTFREADKAGDALRHVTRDYVDSNVVQMPKALLAGLVHRSAGRQAAATAEWRAALAVVEQRLKTNPTAAGNHGDKASLLALLGETAAAEEALLTFEQLRRKPAGRADGATWTIYADLGREADVADFFAERLKGKPTDLPLYNAALLTVHPALDPFRQRPRFRALVEDAERLIATAEAAKDRTGGKTR